jgi:hypothetical protein
MRIRRIGFVLVAAAVLLFAGCGARDLSRIKGAAVTTESLAAPSPSVAARGGDSNLYFASPNVFGSGFTPAGPPSGIAVLPQSRMVIKTASVTLLVKDLDSSFARAIQLTEAGGGFVLSSTEDYEGTDRADLTLKIPSDGFLALIKALEALGTEQQKSIYGEDVTEEFFDLDARLENETAVRTRLFQLLAQAKKVEEAIAVEQELERVGNTINSIEGRMKYLRTMTDMSTINLTLTTDARSAAGGFINWRAIGDGFVTAARVLVQGLFFLLYALIVLIPLAAIALGVTLAVRRILKYRKAARKR